MEVFFDKYIDFAALCATLLLCLAQTVFIFRRRTRIWALPSFFAFFAPSTIVVFMIAHLANNVFIACKKVAAGEFIYDFKFYSLIMLGVLVEVIALCYLISTRKYLCNAESLKVVLGLVGILLVVTVPLIPITPIASVPVIGCAVSLLALPFSRRKQRKADRSTIVPRHQKIVAEDLA
jgi:hypothetical protein